MPISVRAGLYGLLLSTTLNAIVNDAIAGQPTAYVGATLIDGTGAAALENATLVVEGEVISALGSDPEIIPADAEVVNVSGKYIIPGLIDTHVHFMESGRMAMDRQVQALDPAMTEAEDIAWLKGRTPEILSRYLCSGVTTVLSAGGPVHLEFGAREFARTQPYAPRILIAGGPIFNGGFEWIFDGAPAVFAADTPDDIRAMVRDFHDRGADAIKLGYDDPLPGTTDGPSVEQYAPVIRAAVDEAHSLGLPTLVHVMSKSAADGLTDTGLNAFAHLPFDEPVSDEFIAAIVKHSIFIAPTIAIGPRMADVFDDNLVLTDIEKRCGDPEVYETYNYDNQAVKDAMSAEMRPFADRAHQAMTDSVQRLQQAGARFIIGSDASHIGTPHGVAIHIELQMLEAAGLKPATLVEAATRNAAEMLGKDDEFGTLQVGKKADFLVLEANPLDSIANIQYIDTVVANGRPVRQAQLDMGMASAPSN